MNKHIRTYRTFFILWLGCIFGSLAVLPYIVYLTNVSLSVKDVLFNTAISAIISGITVWLGLKLARRVGFRLPLLEQEAEYSIRYDLIIPGLIGGGCVGSVLILLDVFVFGATSPTGSVPVFYGFVSSFYGAINEEVYMRLFLVSLGAWLLQKIFGRISDLFIWISIITVALVFGLSHLPATAKIISLTSVIITRALLLNGIAGVVFGWLYWVKGLECAMWAHFITDILLHVVYPVFAV